MVVDALRQLPCVTSLKLGHPGARQTVEHTFNTMESDEAEAKLTAYFEGLSNEAVLRRAWD